jgi:hypothetical protein
VNLRSVCRMIYILATKCSLRFILYIFENHISFAISVYKKIQFMLVLCVCVCVRVCVWGGGAVSAL